MNASVETLLSNLSGPTRNAFRALTISIGARDAEITAALYDDPRFAAPLTRLVEDLERCREAPFVVRFLGRRQYAPATPALVAAWRSGHGPLSEQAGHALLEIGAPEGLEAMAVDFAGRSGLEATLSLRALARVAPDERFGRVEALVGASDEHAKRLLWEAASAPAAWAGDARLARFAFHAMRERAAVAEAARAYLRKGLSREMLRTLFAEAPASVAPRRSAEAREPLLAGERERMRGIVKSLRERFARRALPDAQGRLDDLERRIGILPASVRAFLETFAGIDVPAEKPRDRLVVYGLDEIEAAVRAWQAANDLDATMRELAEPLWIPIAPDATTKAGQSGGPPSGFRMPCDDDDPPLTFEKGEPRFTKFLTKVARRAASLLKG